MEDAKKLCARLKPDLVLLDIRLPDGSGVEAAREILVKCPQTRVLFLTSFADEHTVLEAILAGAHGYVLKDIASQALIRAIRSVATGQELIDPRITGQTLGWLKNLYREPGHSKRPLLSPQEQRLLPLVAQGLTNKEIAQALGISYETVKEHVQHILRKIGVSDRTQAAVWAVRKGLV